MNNMTFDVRPIPGKTESVFTSRYMEAKVMEDFKLLNEITENYSLGYLTESGAFAMLNILEMGEYRLMETAMDAAEALSERTLEDALNISPEIGFGFIGEGVLPLSEIIKANDGESIYNAYTFERTWDDSTTVGQVATRIANSKESNLRLYKESEGKEGFDKFTRELYSTFPDDRVHPKFLFERAIDASVLSGAMNIEDSFMLKDFISTRFAFAENVGALMPVIPVSGTEEMVPDTTPVKDMVASTDSEINGNEEDMNDETYEKDIFGTINLESHCVDQLSEIISYIREHGGFIAMEGVVYKNNIVFDSESRKIFDKLKKYLRLSNPNDDAVSFKSTLNIKKDRYTFNFADKSVEPNEVVNVIVGSGFKPIKENGVVIKYEKVTKGIKMTAEFTSVDNGVIIFYQADGGVVKESALDEKIEFGLKCDASDVRDAAKRVKKIKENKDAEKTDVEEAVNALDHAIENFREVEKEKKKEKEVKESASGILSELREERNKHYIVNDWYKESAVDGLLSNHPLFCKKRDEVSSMMEGIISNEKEILMRESSTDFVGKRKSLVVEKVTELLPFEYITESSFGKYITDVLFEAPSKGVFESCYDMLENLYNEKLTDEQFVESAEVFAIMLSKQKDVEDICEKVLNNVDFVHDNFMEASEHDIDEDIKETVEVLNRLGYNVKYSCSGHNKTRVTEDKFKDGVYHGKLYTTARLTFDKKYDFKSIPDGWYENKNADKTSIYVRAFTYDKKDGTPNEAFEKWKATYMKSLKDWVNGLGKSKDIDHDTKLESVEIGIMEEFSNTEDVVLEAPDFDTFMESMMEDFM